MIHISKTSFDGSENYFLKNRKLFDFFQREFLQSDSRDLQQTNKIYVLEIHPARTQMVKTPRRNHWRQGSLHHSKVSFIPNIGASQLEEVRHVTDTSKHVGTILNDSLGNRRVVSENFLVPNFCGTRFQINIKIEKQFYSYHDWIPNEFGRGQILITSPLFYFQDTRICEKVSREIIFKGHGQKNWWPVIDIEQILALKALDIDHVT